MSKMSKLATISALLVVVVVLISGTVVAQSPGPPYHYTSYMAKCAEYPPQQAWVTGQVLHLRGVVTAGRTFGDPYFAGEFENTVNIDLNMVTGSGNVHGTTQIMPDAYQGTWQGGHFTGPILNFMYSGNGIDYGTGDLAGLMEVVHIQEIDPTQLPAEFSNPCNGSPALSAFFAEGMIVEQ
ncbi:MAG: hypothetical protein PVH18_00815 [Chloroflexota bacterium]